MLVSRDATELNSPEYRADTEFNDVFINTNKLPDIPYDVPEPDGKPSTMRVAYLPNTLIKGEKAYMVNQKDVNGNFGAPILVTEDQLQDFFMTVNGAVPKTTKKKK
jgi:hypothetical protein